MLGTDHGDTAAPVLDEIRNQLRIRYRDDAARAREAGDQPTADRLHEHYLAVIGSRAQARTELAQGLAQFERDVTANPDAAEELHVRAVLEQRAKAEAHIEQQARKVEKQAVKVRKVTTAQVLAEPTVQAVARRVATWAVTGQDPAAPTPAATSPVGPDPASYGSRNILFSKQNIAQWRVELRQQGLLATGVPSELVYFVGYHLEALARAGGEKSFAEISRRVLRDLGQKVRPLLPVAYLEAQREYVRRGGDATGFDTAAAIEQALQAEQAEQVADRILAALRPAQAGVVDPMRELVQTLTAKVRETLPAAKPAPARVALAHALRNRVAYAAVFEQSRAVVEEKIKKLRVSEAQQQKLRTALAAGYADVTAQPYAEQQFACALQQAQDDVLKGLAGKNRPQRLDTLALASPAQQQAVRQQLIDHVTAELTADEALQAELATSVGAAVDAQLAERRSVLTTQRQAQLPGRVRQLVDEAVALGEEDAQAEARAQLVRDVAQGLDLTDAGTQRLVQEVADVFDARVAQLQQQTRTRAGIQEEGNTPSAVTSPSSRSLPARVAALFAARATEEQIASRLSEDIVRHGVQALGTTLDRIAREHAQDLTQARQTLTDRFVQEAGLSSEQARVFADAIEQRFTALVSQQRQRLVGRLLRPAARPTGAARTALAKLTTALNLTEVPEGASPAEALIRQATKLPDVTPEQVAEFRRLADAVREAKQAKVVTIGGKQLEVVDTKARERAVAELVRYAGQLEHVNWFELPGSLWYAFILSNPTTHRRNILDNFRQSATELALVSLPYNLVATRSLRGGLAPLVGFFRGQQQGLAEAAYVLGTGYQAGDSEKFGNTNQLEQRGSIWRFVGRALAAEDKLNYQPLLESRAYELATREAFRLVRDQEQRRPAGQPALTHGQVRAQAFAKADELLYHTTQARADAEAIADAEGLPAPTAADITQGRLTVRQAAEAATLRALRIDDLLWQARAEVNPTLKADTNEFALRNTFNNGYEGTIGAVSEWVGQLAKTQNTAQRILGTILVPFTRINSNVLNQRLEWGLPFLSYARAVKGGSLFAPPDSKYFRALTPEERVKTSIRATYGAAGWLAAYAAVQAGVVTLTGPGTGNADDDRERPPQSIRLGEE